MGEAARSYQRVLELEPDSDVGQAALERIHSTQSDWSGLIAVYEQRAQLVKDDARRVEILRRAARVASAKLGDPNEAARLYGRLHQVDPTDPEAVDAIERDYERNRDWDKLIAVLTTRLSLTAGGEEAIGLYQRIAQICEEGHRDAERAIEAFRKILDLQPTNKEAIESLARLCEGTEKWAELVEVTRRQIRIVTDRAQKALLYFKCGSVMESKFQKEDDAIRYYDAAIKTSPSCLPAVHGLRDLYLRRQEWPRVIQTLELESKLWTEDKERAGVFAHIGQIYGDKLGNQERAIHYYESAIGVDRECLPANRALFELYFARGEFQRALPLAVILTQKVTREGDPVERSEFYRKRAVVAVRSWDARASV
jgi:tetratricopeptide (TPR) repeat protein